MVGVDRGERRLKERSDGVHFSVTKRRSCFGSCVEPKNLNVFYSTNSSQDDSSKWRFSRDVRDDRSFRLEHH
jgi:hypothetical protein